VRGQPSRRPWDHRIILLRVCLGLATGGVSGPTALNRFDRSRGEYLPCSVAVGPPLFLTLADAVTTHLNRAY
jgi:hypothetical protein